MGRASSTKKVSRAASTGGGRTARGARPYLWWISMSLVVVLGIGGIAFSRQQRREKLSSGAATTPPVANKDHWHSAYGVYLCDSFAAPAAQFESSVGIHTHGDGIIHTHPFTRSAAGKNAVLGLFAKEAKITLTDTEIKLPGGKAYREGHEKCGGKAGEVQVKVNGKVITENVGQIRLLDNQIITIAFAPAKAKLPNPPSVEQLSHLSDVPSASTTIPATGASTTTTGAPSGESTTTSAP